MLHRPWIVLTVLALAAGTARAQSRQIAEEPTNGVDLPATPLAGDQDARAVSMNPGGLQFIGGIAMALAVDADDRDVATSAGQGVGVFVGAGGSYGPFHIGTGVGIEWLRPSRTRLAPDPGSPIRYTLATSWPLGHNAGFGLAWHHFSDDVGPSGGGVGGLSTYDLGFTARLGNHAALGGVIRDLTSPRVGTVPVQRRYELELIARPLGTDRLDFGLGGRIGEHRSDVDGWLRASARLTRGVYLHAEALTRELQVIDTTMSGMKVDSTARDVTGTLGIEVSFGSTGVTAYGSAGLDENHDFHAIGTTLLARVSTTALPAVQGHGARIERMELTGEIDPRELTDIIVRLRSIEHDPAVKAVVFTIDGVTSGWATAQELRGAIRRVTEAGVKTFAYTVAATTRDYFIATGCDKIFMDPGGELRLTGFAATNLYFKGAFDKLGIVAQFEKIAEYKSAPESYTDIGPSAPALEMHNAMYDSMYNELVGAIAESRKLDRATVEKLIDEGPYSAGDLDKDKRLVDAIADPDEVGTLVENGLGRTYPVGEAPHEKDDRWNRPGIAVIYADGDIIDGKSRNVPIPLPLLGGKLVGGDTMVDAIVRARDDANIKAIVLRIDSPGGSALASELMSREVFKTRGVKPIICSMGDVAASGGYYLAAGCDRIFADPMTITGSIGIFTGKFDISGMLAKLGISAVTTTRGKRADMDSFYRPYTEEERAVIHDKIKYMYGRFVGAVAKGRGLTDTQVDDIGRGHVWTGAAAVPIKLVDQLGGLGDAIDYAKQQAGLAADEKVHIVQLPKQGTSLLSLLTGGLRAAATPEPSFFYDLGPVREALQAIPPSLLMEPDAMQARLPYQISW